MGVVIRGLKHDADSILHTSHWSMYTSIWWYLRVLPVLHRPEVVDIGVDTI